MGSFLRASEFFKPWELTSLGSVFVPSLRVTAPTPEKLLLESWGHGSARAVAQWVEWLPITHEALGSIPSTAQTVLPVIPVGGRWRKESEVESHLQLDTEVEPHLGHKSLSQIKQANRNREG